MEFEPETLQKRMKHFKDQLRCSGLKVTHQRLEIFREVAKSGDHPDADRIYKGVHERVPAVSLDTVYRTLWSFLDLGLITTLGPPRKRVRFDANMNSHHHFICTKCGMTRDFYSKKFDTLKIPAAVKALGSVEKTQVEIKGLCLSCSKKESSKPSASRNKEEK